MLTYIAESPLEGFAGRLAKAGLKSSRLDGPSARSRALDNRSDLDLKVGLNRLIAEFDKQNTDLDRVREQTRALQRDMEETRECLDGVAIVLEDRPQTELWTIDRQRRLRCETPGRN